MKPCVSCGERPTRLWLVPEQHRATSRDEVLAYCHKCEPFEGQPID